MSTIFALLLACTGSDAVQDLPEDSVLDRVDTEPAADDTTPDTSPDSQDSSGETGETGDSDDTADETPAPQAPEIDIGFAVIGDYGQAGEDAASVAEMVLGWAPDFIITNGDNNYFDGEAETIDENVGQYYHSYIGSYSGAYGTGAEENRFFPSPGNHDWNSEVGLQPYKDYFELPHNEHYYDVIWGDVHLFSLDSDTHEPDGTDAESIQATWLREALAASTAPIQIAYFHHAAWSSSNHGDSEWMQWPFQEWGVDIVLAGHDHVYERLEIDGLPTMTNGTGGYSLYNFYSDPREGSLIRYAETKGAQRVEIDDRLITFEYIDVEGVMVDSFALDHTAPGANLVPLGSTWRYHTGPDPGEGWGAPEFDDSSWSEGGAPMGVGLSGLETDLGTPQVLYARATFESAAAALGSLELGLSRDDGAAVYLNGIELLRDNLPDGDLSAETWAEAPVDGDETALHWFSLDPGDVVPGENTIAVEIHPSGEDDTDLRFDLALIGAAAPVDAPIFAAGGDWRVLYGEAPADGWAGAVPTDTGAAESFDDSGWGELTAPFGYGFDELAGSLDYGEDEKAKPLTAYARATFTLDAIPDFARIAARCDDGAVLYVNGVEVWRRNLPVDEITVDTPASYALEDDPVLAPTAIDPALLVVGENVIAAEIHQVAADDPDLIFDLELVSR